MKQTKHLLATMAVLLCSLAASAHDFEVGGIYYNITSSTDLTVAVTYRESSSGSYSNEYSGAVTIPEAVTYNNNTYSVKSIGNSAFSGCSSLTAITLPEGVTSIESYAFSYCSSLTAITLPENSKLTSIGYRAFYNCSSLTAITLPEGVTSIGHEAFYDCSSLAAITLPENSKLTSIGYRAFSGCSSLTAITLPEGVTSIGNEAFSNCSSLTSIIFPEGVTSIGDLAFYRCSNLTTITIPEGVTSIGNSAFSVCRSLTAITIPESVTSIGSYAFDYCSSLTAVHISSIEAWCKISFDRYYSNPLSYAHNLYLNGELVTELIIPEGVTSIGEDAFSGCSSLTSITIPESVTSIGNRAFYGFTGELVVNCNIPSASSYSYGAFYNSDFTKVTIGEGVTSIGNYAFYDCSSLTTITIPESVTSIGKYAFDDCTGELVVNCNIPSASYYSDGAFYGSDFTKVTIGEGVTSIGDYAFEYCSSLTSITIPESVTSIGNSAFEGCSSLTSIVVAEGNTVYDSRDNCNAIIKTRINQLVVGCSTTIIPESVTSIGDDAFYGCNFTSITIPESVTSIGSTAFFGCTGELVVNCNIPSASSSSGLGAFSGSDFTKVTIGEGVTSIGNYAFYKCSSLTSITIPEGVTSIGDNAFYNCSSLTAVHISSIEAWCKISFDGYCSNPLYYAHNLYLNGELVTELIIPEGMTSIGDYAFYNCSSLTTVTLPEGVTSIGYNAFAGCSCLTSINIPEGVTSIGGYAFSVCRSLTAITLPESVTSIGNFAFYGCSKLTAITIPEGVTSIGEYAFCDCSSLTAITIPESVTSIGDYAFSNCSSLTAIVLPKSVRSIGSKAFANCGEVLDVYCNAETVPSTNASAFDGSFPEYATLHVPASALETYKSTAPWSSFGTIVPLTDEKVTSITLNQSTATLTEGQTLTLIATVEPGYATDKTITWSSSDSNVATVDDKGKVTAIAPGTATITATANDGSGVSASCEVTVEAATYVSITINQYGSGTYCSKYALDFSEVEGLKAYAATGYNSGTGVVTLVRVMTAKAGEGIFIKGEPGKYMVPILESTLDNTLNMLVGTLAKTEVNATSDDGLYANYKYTIKEGDTEPKFYQFANGSTMGAGKAYLQIPTAWLPAGETRSIGLRFDEGEGTTDMEEFTIDNSPLTIIYDLYGRRVTQPVKGALYIVNGRKVVY